MSDGKKIAHLSSLLLWSVHEALKIQMKKQQFLFLFFFICDCLRNAPHAKGAGLPHCRLCPREQRACGSDGPQAKAGATAGARRQERVCQEGEDEPLGLLPAGAVPGQGWAGGVLPAGQLSAAGLCKSTSTHGCSRTPGSAPDFPSRILAFIMLLSVALGAEDLTDKSGLDLPCPHWDQRGLACRGGT